MEQTDNIEELGPKKLKILVKFPTRERPKKFEEVINRYILMSKDRENITYLISLDKDDPYLQNYLNIITTLEHKASIHAVVDLSKGKIDACNRDVYREKQWDILVLASDDMICQRVGWDEILRNEMEEYYPELDGVLWHNDGFTQQRLNTMCILGRKRYNIFNYIYNPEYTSLWCDNEFMEVSNKDNKQTYFKDVLFRHEHYSNGPSYHNTQDNLLRKNEKYFQEDKLVYERRRAAGFPINKVKIKK